MRTLTIRRASLVFLGSFMLGCLSVPAVHAAGVNQITLSQVRAWFVAPVVVTATPRTATPT